MPSRVGIEAVAELLDEHSFAATSAISSHPPSICNASPLRVGAGPERLLATSPQWEKTLALPAG